MQISIKTNFPDVQRQLESMRKDIADKAMASALNKTLALAKTAMSREIRAEFNMSASKVGEALVVNKARTGGGRVHLEASLESPRKRGRSLNLINFMERSVSMAQARKRGKAGTLNQLFVQIKKAGGKKGLKSAFIGNKGRTVFVRTGKARLPIKAVQTIDVAGMFNTKRVNARVMQMIEARFPDLFVNEAKFFTDRFNAKR
jgi:hypothetical protein